MSQALAIKAENQVDQFLRSFRMIVNPADHFQLLHAGSEQTPILWNKSTQAKGKRWNKVGAKNIKQALSEVAGQEDVYVSVNAFNGWRNVAMVRELNAVFVDVDLGRRATKKDIRQAAELLQTEKLPFPSMVVETGRGIHLYWLIERAKKDRLALWQTVENKLVATLKPMGADPAAKDAARMLRLVGTVNSKTGQFVTGNLYDNKRWKLEELAFAVLGDQAAAKTAKRRERRVISLEARRKGRANGKLYRWSLVMADLIRIGEHHGKIPEGNRNNWLFLVSVALAWFASPDTIEDQVRDLAARYTTLDQSDVKRACQSAVQRAKDNLEGKVSVFRGVECDIRYRFTNEALFERMEGLLVGGLKNAMRAIITKKTAAERKKARDRARFQDHKTGEGVMVSNVEKKASAIAGVRCGKTIRQIALDLGVSPSTIKRWTKGVKSIEVKAVAPEVKSVEQVREVAAETCDAAVEKENNVVLFPTSSLSGPQPRSVYTAPGPASDCESPEEGEKEKVLSIEWIRTLRKQKKLSSDEEKKLFDVPDCEIGPEWLEKVFAA